MFKKLLKITIIFSVIILLFFLFLGVWLINGTDKDLVKKGLLHGASIEQDKLIFQIQEDYAHSFLIRHHGQTVYDQDLGRKTSKLEIANYSSALDDKKVYYLMIFNYSIGGPRFSGFDFCINQQTVFYGKTLEQCLH